MDVTVELLLRRPLPCIPLLLLPVSRIHLVLHLILGPFPAISLIIIILFLPLLLLALSLPLTTHTPFRSSRPPRNQIRHLNSPSLRPPHLIQYSPPNPLQHHLLNLGYILQLSP